MTKPLTGAQIMCEALIREGVEVMFGIPGGAIMPFYYAMWDYRDRLRHVLCRHEQGPVMPLKGMPVLQAKLASASVPAAPALLI
jgi:Thiamine pyrophosphate-requiring enzymes [acetolactate synthase, pyruvate dehydrogenase (cytochrome), glyoxylate carboligase, phosphonopyruvate decarboxylase]